MQEKIINWLQAHDSAYTIEELSQELEISGSKNFVKFVKTIAKMEEQAKIQITDQGKICLPQNNPKLVQGIFRANERGFGFVSVEGIENDIFIPKHATLGAMDNDEVLVNITKNGNVLQDKLSEGTIEKIITRAVKKIVATVTTTEVEGYAGVAKAAAKKLAQLPIYLVDKGLQDVKDEVYQVEILEYPSAKHQNIIGFATNSLGHKDDPGVDILTIVESYDIPVEFDEAVMAEATQIPAEITQVEPGRKDLRNHQIVTIDGESAKDLDDAVEVTRLANGNYQLGVHIADVSYYVKDKSALDKSAYERGTSVYLTDRVIPMLPRRLSNGICSLNPHQDRYTLSCVMEINRLGQVVNYEIFPSIINSKARMTYTAVNEILANNQGATAEEYQEFVPAFELMKELHLILERMREQRGAISFEDTEAAIKLDELGKPVAIELRERGVAERMIESFMLIANETVAAHFERQNLPFIYRIHEKPKEDRIQAFLELISGLGLQVRGTAENINSKDLQAILDEIKDQPEEAMISTMLLRSMQQARYSEEPLGHYGLAATDYTHFTSPIRRYPDLIVHRLIREEFNSQLTEKRQQNWEKRLPDIASHSSQMERRAVDAERETDAMKKAEYMEQHIGEVFEGVISSVTKFGIFVSLPNTIEGLIHLSKMTDDYYEYHDKQMLLVGKRTGRIFRLGDTVKVKVERADSETREIDFSLILPKIKEQPDNMAKLKDKGQKKRKKARKAKTKQPFYKGISKKKRRRRK